MSALKILSGGAAHGLVASLTPRFKAATGLDIDGEFGAVGVMAAKLRDGMPADIVVLTQALIAALARENHVLAASIKDVGVVETAIAVRSADPLVAASDANASELGRLSDALDHLAEVDPSLAELVDLHFFCGYAFREIAELRETSERTVRRDWRKARLLLHQELL